MPNFTVSKFLQLFTEMARTKGSLSPAVRAALEKARRHGGDFSVRDFVDWVNAAGGKAVEANANGYLRKLIPAEGEEPSAEHPIIITQQGRRGPGGAGRYKYAFTGAAGAAPKTDAAKDKVASTMSQFDSDEEELGDDDVEADDPYANGAKNVGRSEDMTKYLPKPNIEGSYAEISMQKLIDAGLKGTNPIWNKIYQMDSHQGVESVLMQLQPNLRRPAIAVAKELFKNLGKYWDGQAPDKAAPNSSNGREVGQSWRKDGSKPQNPFTKKKVEVPAQQASNDDEEDSINLDDLLGDDEWEEAGDEPEAPAAKSDEPADDDEIEMLDLDDEEPEQQGSIMQPEPKADAPAAKKSPVSSLWKKPKKKDDDRGGHVPSWLSKKKF